MFAPYPPDVDWFFYLQGVLDNGTNVELIRDGNLFRWEYQAEESVPFQRPKDVALTLKNHRWLKYFEVALAHNGRYDRSLLFAFFLFSLLFFFFLPFPQ
jgi:hypothetical protein